MPRHSKASNNPIRYRLRGARRVRALTLMVDLDETGVASAIIGVQNMTNRRYQFITLPQHNQNEICAAGVLNALSAAVSDCMRDEEVWLAVR